MILGPKPGCRTPRACPNILFPGSPIRGGALAPCSPSPIPPIATMAGSTAGEEGPTPKLLVSSVLEPKVDEMREFSVGCDGRLGSVGDGSRSRELGDEIPVAECSGIVPLRPAAPLRNELDELMVEAERPCEMEFRELCARDGLLEWRELTV
jgi:hypothetical protein